MSQSRSVSLSCPHCDEAQNFTMWSSINVALNPELKAELKSGALNRLICTACGEQSAINYPVLYHDPERRFMVWLQGEGDKAALEAMTLSDFLADYQLRLVGSRNQLVEKTHALERGLDDRILEMFKVIIAANQKLVPEGDLLFAGMGTGHQDVEELQFAVATESGTEFIGIKRESFEEFAGEFTAIAQAEPLPVGQWHRIDAAYAKEIIRRYVPEAGV